MTQGITDQVNEATKFLGKTMPNKPRVALVLGSGLGPFTSQIQNSFEIPYSDIPHFQNTSVEGHQGRIVCGEVGGVSVAVLQGRWHFYEGHSMNSVVFPTRVLCMLGVQHMIFTNAAGGINLDFKSGDLMLISDHINLMGDNPLTGKEPAEFGPRFPDMSEAYCTKALNFFEETAAKHKCRVQRGVYVGLRGPTYETPAEIRMLRIMGGDAVGMSTVPEVIAARHLGVRVSGISCITNMAAGIDSDQLDHADVQRVAQTAIANFSTLLNEGIPQIANSISQ